jgi:hypothetical protein
MLPTIANPSTTTGSDVGGSKGAPGASSDASSSAGSGAHPTDAPPKTKP